MGRIDAPLLAVLRFGRYRIHPLPRHGIDFRRFAEHHRQHVMGGGRLGQMHVRLQANTFEIGDAVRRQNIVEVLRHRVRIQPDAAAEYLRRAEPQAAHRVFRAMDQIVSEIARLDLLGELLAIAWFENLVHVGQQSA